MTVKTPPLGKEKLSVLKANEARATEAVRAHRKICAQCHNDDRWPRRACQDGWELAKAAALAVSTLTAFTQNAADPASGEQARLW